MSVNEMPASGQGKIETKKKGFLNGRALNYGFIGVDSYMRIKDGEAAPVAVGKAVMLNAAFSMIPGGLPVALGGMALMAAPEIKQGLDDAAGNMNQSKQMFSGGFEPTESSMAMAEKGVNNIHKAKHASMQRHAYRHRHSY